MIDRRDRQARQNTVTTTAMAAFAQERGRPGNDQAVGDAHQEGGEDPRRERGAEYPAQPAMIGTP